MSTRGLFLFFFSFFTVTVIASLDARADEPFRIRLIGSFTGDAANFGSTIRDGMILAKESLPADLAGRIVLDTDDDALLPSRTVTAFRKAIDVDHVDAIVTFSSGTSKAVAPIADSSRVPLVALASDPEVARNRKWVVNLWVTPDTETTVLLRDLQAKNIQRVAIISTVQQGMLAMRDAFSVLNNGKIESALNDEYAPDNKDFRPFFSKLRKLPQVDGFVALLLPGQLGLFAKQARELGFAQPFFGYETFEDPNEVKISGGALIGQRYVNGDDPGADFSRRYSERFPTGAQSFGAAGHDAMLLLADAVRRSEGLSAQERRAKVNDALHTVKDFSGALGTFSSTDDNRFELPAVMKVITKDGFAKAPKE